MTNPSREFDDIESGRQLASAMDAALSRLPTELHAQALKSVGDYLDTAGPGNHVGRVRAIILELGDT